MATFLGNDWRNAHHSTGVSKIQNSGMCGYVGNYYLQVIINFPFHSLDNYNGC